MRGVNKVILVARLGKDPDLKTFDDGGSICNVTAATSEAWKGKDGQPQERTDWHNLTFRGPLAEIAAKYLHKGSKVYVEGQLRTRKWEKEGQTHYATEIHVREMQMLDGAPQGERKAAPAVMGSGGGGAAKTVPAAAFVDDDIGGVPF